MSINICTYWVRFKNTSMGTSRWLGIIDGGERLELLKIYLYHVSI